MAIIGWIACLLLLGWVTFYFVMGTYISIKLGSSHDALDKVIGLIFFVLLALLWYAVFKYAPFTVIAG